jgi:hypothetical protein
MKIRLQFLVAIVTSSTFRTGQPWHQCGSDSSSPSSLEDDPYFCPDGNKCCALSSREERWSHSHSSTNNNDGVVAVPDAAAWGCISGKNPNEGECCQDDLTTGCPEGFTCTLDGDCRNVLNTTDDDEPLPPRLPRYQLCSIQHPYQQAVHYLPSGAAFLSSHPLSPEGLQNVDQLWIVVHGSGHNPDDYLCCAMAVSAARSSNSNTIWIIAPWFLPNDSQIPGLRWAEQGPIDHTWRYGANAVASNVSSYAVLDDLLVYAQSTILLLPFQLEKIIVAGHSAGGQYVQRWALLTSAWTTTQLPAMRAIVANPKSFCWLDARRVFPDGSFRLPNADALAICPTYNEWEWGFDNSTGAHREAGPLYAPYKDAAVSTAGGWPAIVERYQSRDVVYLAGELDVLWNGDCEDRMQGENRRKRSEHFFQSLSTIYNGTTPVTHRRSVVNGVHHDHCLMFQSPEGRAAFFDPPIDGGVPIVAQ